MNKSIVKLLIISILFISLIGCGSTTNGKSYMDGFKRSFKDNAEELEYDEDIEYVLFRSNWKVRDEQRPRLAELIRRMVAKKGINISIQVNEGYFTFSYDYETRRNYHLDIVANCLINDESRWLFIDCGTPYVYDKKLHLDNKWFLSLQDHDKKDIEAPWAWCYYDKKEIENDFWRPTFTYASENYMYMTSGIYLRSY